MDEFNELNMYDVNCDNIKELLIKKESIIKENVPVNVVNDEKYRQLRSIIIKQKKVIQEQDDIIKTLRAISN